MVKFGLPAPTIRDKQHLKTRPRQPRAPRCRHRQSKNGNVFPLPTLCPSTSSIWFRRRSTKIWNDANQAFPFLIEGVFPHVDWHVSRRKIPEEVHGHEAHIKSSIRGTLAIEQVKVIGFFSKKHHRIFTHRYEHPRSCHRVDGSVSGHIDAMTIAPGATLFLQNKAGDCDKKYKPLKQ